MQFSLAAPGAALSPPRQRARLPRLEKVRRDWTSPSVYEPVEAVLEGGEWIFDRVTDGTWTARMPGRAPVKGSLRSMSACRTYVNSGRAAADLNRAQSHDRGEHETRDRKCPKC
jgi:hypothetical protein